MNSAAMLSSSTRVISPRAACVPLRSLQRPAMRKAVITNYSSCGPRGSASFRGSCGPFMWNITDQDRENMKRAWKECNPSTDSEGFRSRSRRDDNFSLVVDVLEDDEMYFLFADVPGLTKDDVKVQVSQKERTLTIIGERKKPVAGQEPAEGEADTQRSKLSERRSGKFERTFKLSKKADIETVSAKVQDGVLSLTINKYQNGGPDVTEIPVSD